MNAVILSDYTAHLLGEGNSREGERREGGMGGRGEREREEGWMDGWTDEWMDWLEKTG